MRQRVFLSWNQWNSVIAVLGSVSRDPRQGFFVAAIQSAVAGCEMQNSGRGVPSCLSDPVKTVGARNQGDRDPYSIFPTLRKHARRSTNVSPGCIWPDVSRSDDWLVGTAEGLCSATNPCNEETNTPRSIPESFISPKPPLILHPTPLADVAEQSRAIGR